VVGFLAGGLTAFSPGCSCNVASCLQSCNGCCDNWGNCIQIPANRSSSTCGLKERVCVDCAASGQLCELSGLTCVPKSDAGMTSCGCTLDNGACAAGTTSANCGSDGGQCQACDLRQTCSEGQCVAGSKKEIGAPCSADLDCLAWLGPAAICKTKTSAGSAVYVDGYCTIPCGQGRLECPGGSTCVSIDVRYGEGESLCWDNCLLNGGDPCRSPGYKCYPVADGGAHGCWISPMPTPDAGPPADKVGLPCSGDAECSSPPDRGGVCLGVERDRHWMGGFCSTASCLLDVECSVDGGALCASVPGDQLRCLSRCAVAFDGGVADGGSGCRQGYLCQGARGLDGGAVEGGVCAPPIAPAPERTGAECIELAQCLVPSETVATCFPEFRVIDAGTRAWSFPGGMCTRVGCREDAECAPDGGGACHPLGPELAASVCFEACAPAGAGCRTGYVCQPDGSDGGFCTPRCDASGNSCPSPSSCDAQSGLCH
jgi:hypothetical protein